MKLHYRKTQEKLLCAETEPSTQKRFCLIEKEKGAVPKDTGPFTKIRDRPHGDRVVSHRNGVVSHRNGVCFT